MNIRTSITITKSHELETLSSYSVFMQVLEQLKKNHHIDEDGYLVEVTDMQGHGSDVYERIDLASRLKNDSRYQTIIMACWMETLMKDLCSRTFEPHRYYHGRCTDCRKEEKPT